MEQNKTLTTNSTNSTISTNTNPTVTINANGVVQESVKQASFSMDKSSLLIIVLLFMFSSKLWDMAWDIGKSLLYIIIIIYLIGFVNQDLADNIKNIIHDFTNVNATNNVITDLFAKLCMQLKNILNIGQISMDKVVKEVKSGDKQEVEKFTSATHTSLYDGTSNLSGGNTKNLANMARSDSKNIFA